MEILNNQRTLKRSFILMILLFALAAIVSQELDRRLLFSILKPLTTITVILLVFKLGLKSHEPFRRRMLIALIFCCIGDALLLNDQYFVFGLAAFLIAHLVFIFAFISRLGFQKQLPPLLLMLLIAASFYLFLFNSLGELKIPVAIYMTCIVVMAWQAINGFLVNRNPATLFIALGSSLFVLSDALLALEKFHGFFPYSTSLVLATYWLAISCLGISTTLK